MRPAATRRFARSSNGSARSSNSAAFTNASSARIRSYQIAFDAARLDEIVPWLVLNHGALDIFLHPNTNDELRDHRDCAVWIGKSYQLNLDALAG